MTLGHPLLGLVEDIFFEDDRVEVVVVVGADDVTVLAGADTTTVGAVVTVEVNGGGL